MYHIPADLRAEHSAEKIVNGLEDCLTRFPIQSITVSQLCKACGIGRATFYRLFDNLTDVLAYRCDSILDDASDIIRQQPELTPREISLFILKNWMKHPLLMRALVEGQHIEILYQSHRRHITLLKERTRQRIKLNDASLEIQLDHLCLLLPVSLFVWYRNGATESPEQLYDHFVGSLRLWAKVL